MPKTDFSVIIYTMKIKVSENLHELAQRFEKYGQLFVVGGYVRNSLLGFTETDIDIASRLSPEKISSILKNTKFEIIEKLPKVGTVKIKCGDEIYEHTTFRRDNYFADGNHDVESVNYVDDLREDAMRRDFTINALYYEILTEKIVDIYSGLHDLRNGVIRTVEVPGYVLAHDGVRILRMVRQASELDFKIDYATFATAKKNTRLLADISPYRKFSELLSILTSSRKYPVSKRDSSVKGLTYFNDLRIWQYFYVPASKIKLRMVKKLDVENALYGLLIDIIDTVNPDCIEYFIKDLLGKNGFNQPNAFITLTNHIICGYYDALNRMNNKHYFFKYFNYFDRIGQLLIAKSKKLYSKYKFFQSYIIKHQLPISLKELALNGNDLKSVLPDLPERKYSQVLYGLLEKVFDGVVTNEKEALIAELKTIKFQGETKTHSMNENE